MAPSPSFAPPPKALGIVTASPFLLGRAVEIEDWAAFIDGFLGLVIFSGVTGVLRTTETRLSLARAFSMTL